MKRGREEGGRERGRKREREREGDDAPFLTVPVLMSTSNMTAT